MFTTHTGNFPIGFRRGGSDWQKELPSLVAWAKDHDFGALDLGRDAEIAGQIASVQNAGLQVGSVDLLEWQPLFDADAGKRAASVEKNSAHISQAAQAGAKNFFLVVLPADPKLKRAENFAFTVESLSALVPTLESAGAKIVIEGWPGAGALCCTPESYRALFEAIPSMSIGINYDPSHLVRMGIDPIRFLREFAPRVAHVHGKDCVISTDDLYEYGWEQPATFKKSPAFGAAAWRYTIPGQGQTPWKEALKILVDEGYNGAVCIELEDENYNGSQEGEQAGFIAGAQFLSAC